VLTLCAARLAVFGFAAPDKLPLCFSPDGNIVCPTSTHVIVGHAAQADSAGQPSTLGQAEIDPQMRRWASGWDIFLVALVGLLAAAIAAAAVLGLVLMRGEFIPGLSALDSSAQIISWAVILGYSQQLLTRFVDQRAQTVLENFARTPAEQQRAHSNIDTAPASV